MNEDIYDNDILFRYLEGELPQEEALRMELLLKSDPQLRERLERLTAARKAVEHYGLVEQVRAIHHEMVPTIGKPMAGARLYRVALSVAAVLIVMLTLATLYMYRQLKPSNIYRENFYPYMLTSDRSEKEQDTLSSAYKKGRMTEVRAIFSTLRSPSARDYFLAANSFLALGKPDSAIANFRKLLQLDRQRHQHEFEDDTEYYLAMSYLRAGLIADALPLFRKIQADPQHPYHDKVGSWLIRRLRWAQ